MLFLVETKENSFSDWLVFTKADENTSDLTDEAHNKKGEAREVNESFRSSPTKRKKERKKWTQTNWRRIDISNWFFPKF